MKARMMMMMMMMMMAVVVVVVVVVAAVVVMMVVVVVVRGLGVQALLFETFTQHKRKHLATMGFCPSHELAFGCPAA